MKKILLIPVIASLIMLFNYGSSLASINSFIDNVYPNQNAVSVGSSDNIVITFAQNMNASTMDSITIKTLGQMSGLLQVSFSYDVPSKILTINPALNFKYGEQITVIVKSDVKTSSAVSVTPFVFKFTVESKGGNALFSVGQQLDSAYGVIRTGDIDNDNDIDIVSAYVDRTMIFRNNGSGVFTKDPTILRGTDVNLTDFNNDGYPDLLILKNDSVYFYKNDRTGSFNFISAYKGKTGVTGDLNGDGFLDIAYTNSVNNTVLKNINGVFSIAGSNPLTTCSSFNNYTSIRTDDMNNDGFSDLTTISDCYSVTFGIAFGYREVDVFYNSPAFTFTKQNILNSSIAGTEPFLQSQAGNMVTFDYNNDNFVDVVSSQNKFTNGGFENYYQSSMNTFFLEPIFGDFNGDVLLILPHHFIHR